MDWAKMRWENLSFGFWCVLYWRFYDIFLNLSRVYMGVVWKSEMDRVLMKVDFCRLQEIYMTQKQINETWKTHINLAHNHVTLKVNPSFPVFPHTDPLTHWGWAMHICVSDLTSIGSDNGLSPGRRQAIIRTNAGILLIRPLEQTSVNF